MRTIQRSDTGAFLLAARVGELELALDRFFSGPVEFGFCEEIALARSHLCAWHGVCSRFTRGMGGLFSYMLWRLEVGDLKVWLPLHTPGPHRRPRASRPHPHKQNLVRNHSLDLGSVRIAYQDGLAQLAFALLVFDVSM
jgi:hypothetical protein